MKLSEAEDRERHERLGIMNILTTKEGNTYPGWIEAFRIFEKYQPGASWPIDAEHDEVYAGPDPREVSDEDLVRLAQLGWTDSGGERFCRNV